MRSLFIFGVLLPLFSLATPRIDLNLANQQNTTTAQKEILKQFVNQTALKLPAKVLSTIDGIVEIQFSDFQDQNQTPAKFDVPQCLDIRKLTELLKIKVGNDFDGRPTQSPQGENNIRGNIYGKTEKSFWHHRYTITINNNFMPVIYQGLSGQPGTNTEFPCGHKNLYNLATATLIHELIHVFDDENYPATHDSEEIKLRQTCQGLAGPKNQPPIWCQRLLAQRHSISDRPSWKNLVNWNGGTFTKHSENQLGIRSPDFYEITNLAEALAVNSEYFFTDSEYYCRRPEFYEYLAQHFEFSPFPNRNCSPQTEISYSTKNTLANLNWKNLYEIHYLMADKGEGFESSFGHAMFRLVFCDPKRLTNGALPNSECLKDQQQHVVISFRASINGLTTDKLKGLTGQYPSQMFVYPLGHVISEYTVSQFRNLTSFPLKLNEAQKRHFIQRVLQTYWEYQSKYYFIGNNCATEALNFIKGVVFTPKVQEHSTGIETPNSVLSFLKENGLIDESFKIENDSEGRYFFPSYGIQINENLKELGFADTPLKTIYDVTDQYSSEERLQLYNSFKAKIHTDVEIKNLAIRFYRLERAVSLVYEQYKQDLLNEKLIVDPSKGPVDPGYRQGIRQILIDRSQLAPWLMTTQGYGIPMASERKSIQEIAVTYESINKAQNQLEKILIHDNPELYSETDKINSNLNNFFNEIKNHVGSKLNSTKENK